MFWAFSNIFFSVQPGNFACVGKHMSSSSANSAVVASDRINERFKREQHALFHEVSGLEQNRQT